MMGVDAMMYVKTRDGLIPDDVYQVDFSPVGKTDYDYGLCPAGADFRVECEGRMYRPGYERGHWPTLSALLLELLACRTIESVWYFGDDAENENDVGDPIDTEYINRMNEHFVENGYR